MGDLTSIESLKIHAFETGMSISPEATGAWREQFAGPLSLNEYPSTSGVIVRLADVGGPVYISAPYKQDFAQKADTRLDYRDGFVVEHDGAAYDATVAPVPAYHRQHYRDEDGVRRRFTETGVTHTDRVRVSPVEGCSMDCGFCDLPDLPYRMRSAEELLRVIDLAQDDPLLPARHVLISGGTPRRKHEPQEDDLYEEVIDRADIPVDIMMTPREDTACLRRLAAVGINSLSVNIEVIDPDRAREITNLKDRRFSRDYFLSYLEKVVGVLGVGRVQSLVLVGSAIEPVESTMAGVTALVERGVIPVLSPFRPAKNTAMRNAAPASETRMREVYLRTMDVCANLDTGVQPGPRCVACTHNTLSFGNRNSDFYLYEEDDITRQLRAKQA